MRVVTYEDVRKMNELYAELKTYAAVSRATGFSPSTVRKYIKPDYTPVSNIIRFNRPLPEFDPLLFLKDDWGDLCVLSLEEIEEIKLLWKEIDF